MATENDKYELDIDPEVANEQALVQLLSQMGELTEALLAQTEAMKKADDQGEKLGDEQEKLAKKTESTNKETGKLAKSLKVGVVGAMAGVLASGALVVGMLDKLKSKTLEYSEAGGEQQALDQALFNTMVKRSKSVEEATKEYEELNQAIAQFSNDTGIGDEVLLEAAELYLRTTKDAKLETEELAVMAGIAKAKKTDLRGAAEQYAKAMKGEVGALMELTNLTKGQVDALNAEKNETVRVAKAKELLATQYGGNTKAANTARLAYINNKNALGDLDQTIGQVINTSGLMEAIYNPLTESVRKNEAAIKDNAEGAQRLAITVAQNVVTALSGFYEMGMTVLDFVLNFRLGWDALSVDLGIGGKAIELSFLNIGNSAVILGEDILEPLLERFEGILDMGEQLANFAGMEDFAKGLGDARDQAKGFRASLKGMSKDASKEILQGEAELRKMVKEGDARLRSMVKDLEDIRKKAAEGGKIISKIQGNLINAKNNVSGNLGPKKTATPNSANPTKPVANKSNQEAAVAQAQLAATVQIAQVEAQILKAKGDGNDLRVIELERTKAVLEAQKAAVGEKNKELAALNLANATEAARLDFVEKRAAMIEAQVNKHAELNLQKELLAAQQVRLDALGIESEDQRRLKEIEAQRIEINARMEEGLEKQIALRKLEIEEQKVQRSIEAERFAAWSAFLNNTQVDISGIFSSGMDALLSSSIDAENEQLRENVKLQKERAKAIDGVLNASVALGGALVDLASKQWDFKTAQDATIAGMQAGVGIASGLTSLFVEDIKERARWEAGINAAAALGAWAALYFTGNPAYLAAATTYTAASIQHGIIAGSSAGGASGPPSSASIGGGGRTASAIPEPSRETMADNAKLLAEAIAEANRDRDGQTVQVNIYDPMLLGNSPETVNELSRELGPGIMRVMRGGDFS